MMKDIVIYQDDGVGAFGLSCLRRFFARQFPTAQLRLCDAADVTGGGIFSNCDLLVMPGGADLPYCAKLDGAGNRNIRSFVEQGGTYLGICAGAYYACASIEYHKGRTDEICASRELALIDAVALGSLREFAPPYDETLGSASILSLTGADGKTYPALYHGGCTFRDIPQGTTVTARYPDGRPAIIRSGNVILSGVHFEVSAANLAAYPAHSAEEAAQARLLGAALPAAPPSWMSLLRIGENPSS